MSHRSGLGCIYHFSMPFLALIKLSPGTSEAREFIFSSLLMKAILFAGGNPPPLPLIPPKTISCFFFFFKHSLSYVFLFLFHCVFRSLIYILMASEPKTGNEWEAAFISYLFRTRSYHFPKHWKAAICSFLMIFKRGPYCYLHKWMEGSLTDSSGSQLSESSKNGMLQILSSVNGCPSKQYISEARHSPRAVFYSLNTHFWKKQKNKIVLLGSRKVIKVPG